MIERLKALLQSEGGFVVFLAVLAILLGVVVLIVTPRLFPPYLGPTPTPTWSDLQFPTE